jgi:hypothetical protein
MSVHRSFHSRDQICSSTSAELAACRRASVVQNFVATHMIRSTIVRTNYLTVLIHNSTDIERLTEYDCRRTLTRRRDGSHWLWSGGCSSCRRLGGGWCCRCCWVGSRFCRTSDCNIRAAVEFLVFRSATHASLAVRHTPAVTRTIFPLEDAMFACECWRQCDLQFDRCCCFTDTIL